MTATAEIDVEVPIAATYRHWARLEAFPEFLHSVDSVEPREGSLTHWTVTIDGVPREFDVEVVADVPEHRIAWSSTDGTTHTGRVDFALLEDDATRVTLTIAWHDGDGHPLLDEREVESDLRRFKGYVESRERGPAPGEILGI